MNTRRSLISLFAFFLVLASEHSHAEDVKYGLKTGKTWTYALSIELRNASGKRYISGIVALRVIHADGDVVTVAAGESLHEVASLGDLTTDKMLREFGHGKYLPQEFQVHLTQGVEVDSLENNVQKLPCGLGSLATWLVPALPPDLKSKGERIREFVDRRAKQERTNASPVALPPIAAATVTRFTYVRPPASATSMEEMSGTCAVDLQWARGEVIKQSFHGKHISREAGEVTTDITIAISKVKQQTAEPFEKALANLIAHGETRVPDKHWTEKTVSLRPSGQRVTREMRLVTGLEVMVRYRGGWYTGHIMRLHADGSLDVEFKFSGGAEVVTTSRESIQLHRRTNLTSEARKSALRNLKSRAPIRIKAGLSYLHGKVPIPDDEMTLALVMALHCDDASLRRSVLYEIEGWATPKCVPALARLFQVDAVCRSTTRRVLVSFGTTVEPYALALFRTDDDELLKATARLLQDVGTAKSLPYLQQATKHSDVFIRSAAASAIKSIQKRAAG